MGIIDQALTAVITNSDRALHDAIADGLAWLHDAPANTMESWPGPGWQDQDGPPPSWDAEPFEPEPIAAAYQLGYELGLAGEYPKPPAHLSEREAYFFTCGRLAGFIASEDGKAWYRDMDTLEDRPADRDEWETIRAVGSVEARGFIELEGGGW